MARMDYLYLEQIPVRIIIKIRNYNKSLTGFYPLTDSPISGPLVHTAVCKRFCKYYYVPVLIRLFCR